MRQAMDQTDEIQYDQIAAVGEYTVPSGPDFDDHFLVIVYRSEEWIAIPAQTALPIIPQIETAIGVKIQWGLANVTDAASRVMFPAGLAERPLLNFSRSKFGIRKLFKLIRSFGVDEIHSHLTDEVSQYIRRLADSEAPHNRRHSPSNSSAR